MSKTQKTDIDSSTSTVRKDRPVGVGSYGVVWDVLDPRNGKRVALKKMTKVFESKKSAKMVFRELRMLCTFQHENVLAALEVVQPPSLDRFDEVYILTDLLHTDLHQIIWSKQTLTADHMQVFIYQIMRGLKYIHSAKVIHRDIKPGNILVYDNCALKIGDFGMARAEATDASERMALDVVTMDFRAPEFFMGAKNYTGAIDIWAAACVFAELLGRKVLFDSQCQVNQLTQMVNLLGTPSTSDIYYASVPIRNLVANSLWKPSRICTLRDLSPFATEEAVDLLSKMLTFNPIKRISAAAAMEHPYMVQGRKLYHSGMCKCCSLTSIGLRVRATDLEPVASKIFDDRWEQEITSVEEARLKMHQYIRRQMVPGRQQLSINPDAEMFKKFGLDS